MVNYGEQVKEWEKVTYVVKGEVLFNTFAIFTL